MQHFEQDQRLAFSQIKHETTQRESSRRLIDEMQEARTMRNLYGTSARRTGCDKHVAKTVTVNPHLIVRPHLKRINKTI